MDYSPELKRIIIADDHPVVVLGARLLIESAGLGEVVAEASNPMELLGALKRHPCDLLIADLSMPLQGMVDGYAMIAGIRGNYPQLPIIMMTGVLNMGIIERLLALGSIAIVGKGADMDELPLAINSVGRGTTYISRQIRERRMQMGHGNAPVQGTMASLSPKELEVVRLLVSGQSVTQVAETLHRSKATISRQKHNAMKKLGATNNIELYEIAKQEM